MPVRKLALKYGEIGREWFFHLSYLSENWSAFMSSCWYLLRIKPGKARFVSHLLQARGIESFWPRLHTKVKSRRAGQLRACLANYVFICLDPEVENVRALNWLPGTYGLVESNGEPVNIPESLVSRIRRHLGNRDTAVDLDPEQDRVEIQRFLSA